MTNILNAKPTLTPTVSSYDLKNIYVTSFQLLGRPDTSRPLTPGWNVRSEPDGV
ncbi:MAG: hypothetical protein AB7L13_01730 [Acidimicrobiia bacterium]